MALVTANCSATNKEKALQNRIDQLENELAGQQPAPVLAQPKKIKTSDDPLYETYKILHRIQDSKVNEVSSLSFAQNTGSPHVTVFPLDGSSARASGQELKSLKQRAEQYPRHLLQLGQDVYTEQQQQNIIVFPVKDPAIEDLKPVEPVTRKTGGRLLSAPDRQLSSGQPQSLTSNKRRRLTGY